MDKARKVVFLFLFLNIHIWGTYLNGVTCRWILFVSLRWKDIECIIPECVLQESWLFTFWYPDFAPLLNVFHSILTHCGNVIKPTFNELSARVITLCQSNAEKLNQPRKQLLLLQVVKIQKTHHSAGWWRICPEISRNLKYNFDTEQAQSIHFLKAPQWEEKEHSANVC